VSGLVSDVATVGIAWLAVLLLVCVASGARTADRTTRLLLADVVAALLVGVLALQAARTGQAAFLDAALALALFAFLATVVGARYARHGRPW
jgi:multicomponent Na+:H+ antiporter subunit F